MPLFQAINSVHIVSALLTRIALKNPVGKICDIHVGIVIAIKDPAFMTESDCSLKITFLFPVNPYNCRLTAATIQLCLHVNHCLYPFCIL